MSKLYSPSHRNLQDTFATRNLADAVENIILRSAFTDADKAFIESRDMFFLSTIDDQARPSVSYKGGEPGFIKIVDENTLAFPSYDGNGMFLSMGNLSANEKVGLLFIDFENPHRLRAYGEASVDLEDPLLSAYHEAQLIVRIQITELWQNCPRYVHRYCRQEKSKYVPSTSSETPLPDWKKIDKLQPLLPPADQGKAEKQGGTITVEEMMALEARDD
ncbi:MAG: pyridoxamine 5'-phosphate oxidase family protein [Acidiferrobacterales bacterium]|nr:pyridoxamine 5'-phosphate oxidase family protein [Acidiferrobacterales bacterium]